MINRTIYDVLDKVMEDYSYSIRKTGNKVELKGEVYIERLDMTVTHEKTVYCVDGANPKLQQTIEGFGEEFKNKVVKVLTEYKLVLTDDDEMIKKLMAQCKELREELENAREREKKLQERVIELEIEKYGCQVNPLYTGVTNDPDYTGTPPDEWHYHITCDNANSAYSTGYGTELPEGIPIFRKNNRVDQLKEDNQRKR